MPTKVSIPSNSFVFGTTPPSTTVGFNDNDTYVQTSDGTATGTYIAQWKFDRTSDKWVNTTPSVSTFGQVPAPRWDVPRAVSAKSTLDGFKFIGPSPFALSHLIPPDLLGSVAIEYGRHTPPRRKNRTRPSQGSRIRWYSNWVEGSTIAATEGGGAHTSIEGDRPTRTLITQQNGQGVAVPYESFYRMREVDAFLGVLSHGTHPVIQFNVPCVTGFPKVRPLPVDLYLPGGRLFGKRPSFGFFRSMPMVQRWYARLVLLDEAGRVITYGPTSTELRITPNSLPFSTKTMSVASFRTPNNVDRHPLVYRFTHVRAEA